MQRQDALAGRWGPVLLALAFGLLSVPLVAASLVQTPQDWQQEIVHAPPVGWFEALLLALVSAVTAAVVGGSFGGRLVRSRPDAAVLVAIGVAWPVGIGMLSITAAAFGIGLRVGILCIDTCTPEITNANPLSGFVAYPQSLLGAAVVAVPVVAFIVLMAVAWWLGRRRRFLAGIVLTVVAYAVLHLWSILLGGFIAFACLAIGVVIWGTVLHRPWKDAELKRQPGGPAIPPMSRA